MTGLDQEIRESGWIHFPLPLHRELSLEAEGERKEVLKSRSLSLPASRWRPVGKCVCESAGGLVRLRTTLYEDGRPGGDLEQGDCSNYGLRGLECNLLGENWEMWNRLSFRIRADVRGVRKICGLLQLKNAGKIPLPDPLVRQGFHVMNLISGEETRIRLEIPSLPRDRITGISLSFYCGGCETDADLGNELLAEFGDFTLEQIAGTEVDLGWAPEKDRIAFCFSGYRTEGEKRAVLSGHTGETFWVENEEGQTLLEGVVRPTRFRDLGLLDFSALRAHGRHRLVLKDTATDFFEVSPDIWLPSAWKVLNFLFCQRCGYPVPGIHQTCHRDLVASHGGRSFVFNGGWHDAGDLSQQLCQSAEVTFSLMELAAALPGEQADLRLRLREEALWGLDYVLRSRFGDGYRATSVGTATWSRGFMGDRDDIRARVHSNAYENYLCAFTECFCAMHLRASDPLLAQTSLEAARADFAFAQARFRESGFSERPPVFWEHSWMTPESVFSATRAMAALLLLESTGEDSYAPVAVEALDYVLSCQETDPAGPLFPEGGFFWRSPEKKSIVHFSHQARDQVFARALSLALRVLPAHPAASMWRCALFRHAQYFRRLSAFASPYGMMPAGLYRMEEAEDRESFERQHLLAGEDARLHYPLQLRSGTPVGDGYFLRQFPVWFSFRGNNAVLLSMGKAAALCGNALGDRELLKIAERQLQWNTGLNPFRQSLMYGEGKRYAQQYAAMSGEAVGELPVGVQTLEDEDRPYWPQMNFATYREVWTTPAARWLSLLAELLSTWPR